MYKLIEQSRLTPNNYFDDLYHMSNSRFKRLLECEVDGLQGFGEPTEPMLIGSYIDSYVEGTLEEFIKEHPQIISSRGPTKGQLKAGFKQADDIIEFINNDETIQQFLSGEKQRVFTGEIAGVPFKAMLDIYSEGIAINDLKVLRSITRRDGSYYDFITQWRYDFQGAIYQELVRQATGEQLPFFLVVVTKENPINSAIVNIDQDTLDRALYEIEENVQRLYEVYTGKVPPRGCGVCSSCIRVRKKTPIISMGDLQEGEVI